MLQRLLTVTLISFGLAQVAPAQERPSPPEGGFVIATTGRVVVPPDVAVVDVGVVTQGKTAADALAANKPAMNALIDLLKTFGVAGADAQTSHMSVTPRYTQPPVDPSRPRPSPTIDGYTATINLRITLRDLDRVGALLEAMAKQGANQIGHLRFDATNRDALLDQARAAAAKEARKRAELYAAAIGTALGPLLRLTEPEAVPAGEPEGYADLPARKPVSAGGPLLIKPGEIVITARVVTSWKIGN